jgi:hypothetical protein
LVIGAAVYQWCELNPVEGLVIGAAVILDSYNGGIHQICQKCILD